VIKIPMRECVIRSIYKTQWIASLRKIMSIRNRLSQRLCRDAIYCVLQRVSSI